MVLSVILPEVKSWWHPFNTFLAEKKNMTWTELETLESFQMALSDFLFDVSNAKQQYNFKFDGSLVCNEPAPRIMVRLSSLIFCNYSKY